MKVQCTGCHGDCSRSYGTWRGDPYHFGCIPTKRERPVFETEEEANEAADNGRNTGGKSYR